jgi:5-methylcytosine-specific restriction endonuclease McrA
MAHALVLNATYEPLCVVAQRRALLLVLSRKAISLEGSDVQVHSATYVIEAPSVVRLTRYVRVPYHAQVPLTRARCSPATAGAALLRAPAATIDHVVPRSRAESRVDQRGLGLPPLQPRQGDRSMTELGWRLRSSPSQPTGVAWRIIGTGRSDPRWAPYLAAFGADHLLGEATA